MVLAADSFACFDIILTNERETATQLKKVDPWPLVGVRRRAKARNNNVKYYLLTALPFSIYLSFDQLYTDAAYTGLLASPFTFRYEKAELIICSVYNMEQ